MEIVKGVNEFKKFAKRNKFCQIGVKKVEAYAQFIDREKNDFLCSPNGNILKEVLSPSNGLLSVDETLDKRQKVVDNNPISKGWKWVFYVEIA